MKRKIQRAQKRIDAQIAAIAMRGRIAAGLAGEGYLGGYRDALSDVLLLMAKAPPCLQPRFWEDEPKGAGEMKVLDWDRISQLVSITPDRAIKWQTLIRREFPDLDLRRLIVCIDGRIENEEIQWGAVREDYETEGVGVDD